MHGVYFNHTANTKSVLQIYFHQGIISYLVDIILESDGHASKWEIKGMK